VIFGAFGRLSAVAERLPYRLLPSKKAAEFRRRQCMQTGSTAKMIFPIVTLISYISRFMRLMPGDVVTTGTPHGVGLGMKPPVFLKAGDVVELGIDGLGKQRQIVTAFGK